jgi:hypothetical protein
MRIDADNERFGLQQECRMFTRYLVHREPDAYVVQKYVECHFAVLRDAPTMLPIDSRLVRFAGRGTLRTRIADAYARIFRPWGLLRRKLILVFAILENSRAYHREFFSEGGSNGWAAWLRIASSMAGFLVALTVGMAVFLPHHLFTLVAAKRQRK